MDSLGTMKHDCERIQKLISKRHLAKQTLDHDPEIKTHLQICPSCRNYVEWLDHDHKELINYADSLDEFVDNFKSKVSQEAQNGHSHSKSPRLLIPIIASVVLLLGVSVGLVQRFTQSQKPTVSERQTPSGARASSLSQRERRRLVRTLQKAKQLRGGHDIKGLIELLNSDLAQVRQMAAIYLGQIGDERALAALEGLAQSQDPNQSPNRFAEAMTQIQARKNKKTNRATLSPAPGTPLPAESNDLRTDLTQVSSVDSHDAVESHATTDPLMADFNSIPFPLEGDGLPVESELRLGVTGCIVKGQFMIPTDSGPVAEHFRPIIVSTHRHDQLKESLSPQDFEQMSPEQIEQWCLDTLTVKAPPQTAHVVAPNAFGEFQWGPLGPGAYAIMGKLRVDPNGQPETNLGRFWHEFEIPDATEPDSVDVSIDLGIIPFIPGDLIIGDVAPFFSLPLLDGGITSLSDHHDIMLLSFYDIEDVPKHATSFETLRHLYDRFSNSDSYTQLALVSSQRPPLVVLKQTELLDLPWAHGFVGKARQNRQYIDFDLPDKGPWNVLIDGNGHIAGIGLDNKALIEAIEYLLMNN